MSRRLTEPAAVPGRKRAEHDAAPALQGEGNYTAARRHRRSVERFVQSGAVEPAARRAAPADDDQARELLDAEQAARSRRRK